MNVGERLRALRNEKGLSKRDVASILPLNYSTYGNYESNLREPNLEALKLFSRYFDVSIDYIIGTTNLRRKADDIAVLEDAEQDFMERYRALDTHGKLMLDTVIKLECDRMHFPHEKPMQDLKQVVDKKWVTLQVYNPRASAGLGDYLNEEGSNDYEMMRFVSTPVSLKADFCVRIKGDSMEPKLCDGNIVFIKAMPQIEPGGVGAFTCEGEFYCKRLRIDTKKGAVYLESLNKAYAPKLIQHPESLRTVGLVIGVAE